jgi:hypothetical protein
MKRKSDIENWLFFNGTNITLKYENLLCFLALSFWTSVACLAKTEAIINFELRSKGCGLFCQLRQLGIYIIVSPVVSLGFWILRSNSGSNREQGQ